MVAAPETPSGMQTISRVLSVQHNHRERTMSDPAGVEDAMQLQLATCWNSPEADRWTCIPGRICGGGKMMKDAYFELQRLRSALQEIAVGKLAADSIAGQRNTHALLAARLCGIARDALRG